MADPSTPEGRAELRKLLDKATIRPWTVHADRYGRNEVTARHADGWNEVVAQVGRVCPDAELIVAAVNALPALLDALDEAESALAAEVSRAARQRMDDADRWYDQAMQGLSTVTSTARQNGKNSALRAEKAEVALDRVRSYIPTLHALADTTRDAGGDYLAHTFREIASTLERKIGDRP